MKQIIPVLIPAYEPNGSFVSFINDLSHNVNQDIIVVDDGSGEQYRDVFEAIATFERVTVIKHAINLGKGRSLKDAFNVAMCIYPTLIGVVTADSDGQHTVYDIKKNNSRIRKRIRVLDSWM